MATIKERLLKALADHRNPVHWRALRDETGLNKNSVRSDLSKLVKSGAVERPYKGFYRIKAVGGMGVDKPLLVHSVQLRWVPGDFVVFAPVVEEVGSVIIKVGRDVKRRRVSGFIGHPVGMDLDLFRSSLLIFRLKVKDLFGRAPLVDELQVINVQFNRDLEGVRLEGLKAVTVTSVLGVMERFYNKPWGVRTEVQAAPRSVRDIEIMLRGGVTMFNVAQSNFVLAAEVRRLIDVQKGQAPILASIYRLMEELLKRM